MQKLGSVLVLMSLTFSSFGCGGSSEPVVPENPTETPADIGFGDDEGEAAPAKTVN